MYPTDPSRFGLVFQTWGDGKPLLGNLHHPTLLSIASVRGRHPTLPIYVMDYGEIPDWGDFPTRFNFTLIQRPCFLERHHTPRKEFVHFENGLYLGKGFHNAAGDRFSRIYDLLHLRFTSRFLDLVELGAEIDQDYLIYLDADILALDDLFPLACPNTGLSVRGDDNAGMIYFDKRDADARDYLDLVHAFTLLATRSFPLRCTLLEEFPQFPYVTEECITKHLRFRYTDGVTPLTNDIPREEHFLPDDLQGDPGDWGRIKLLHLFGYGLRRGCAAVLIKEVYTVIRTMFTREEMDASFGLLHFNRNMVSRADLGGSQSLPRLAELMK